MEIKTRNVTGKLKECIDNITPESLAKTKAKMELEEASRNYADNEEYGDDVYFAIKAAFKAGANWQKEQILKDAIGDYWIARDKNVARPLNIYENIPERVHLDDGRKFWRAFHHSINLPSELFDEIQWENEPQKAKLIIIKEEPHG